MNVARKTFHGRIHHSIKRKSAADRTVDGILFDSGLEATRYGQLKILARAGEIWDLKIHPLLPMKVFDLHGRPHKIGRGSMTIDFAYTSYRDGAERRVYEDVKPKGVDTREARLRRRIAEISSGITIDVVEME